MAQPQDGGGRPTAVVTGANRGLGRAVVRVLARRGYRVVLHARTPARARATVEELAPESGRGVLEPVSADLERPAEIDQAVATILAQYDAVDVLVNSAGVLMSEWRATEEGLETSLAVNHLGTARLTLGLLPALLAAAPSRVIVMSSLLHARRYDPEVFRSSPTFSGRRAYVQTKLLNLLFAFDLAEALEGSGVDVNAVHPGTVDTELLDRLVGRSPAVLPLRCLKAAVAAAPLEGAATPEYVATAPELTGRTGRFIRKRRELRGWKAARDPGARDRARSWTRELAGVDWREAARDALVASRE